MSLVFVVASEEDLTSGAPWCKKLTEVSGGNLHVLVLGTDLKTLAEFARRKLPDLLQNRKVVVEMVEAEPVAISEYIQRVSGKTLLISFNQDALSFQKSLFEASPIRTLWVQTKQPPPDVPSDAFTMIRQPRLITSIACQDLFGFLPDAALCDIEHFNGVEDRLQFLQSEIETKQLLPNQLVLCGVDELVDANPVYKTGLALMTEPDAPQFGLVYPGHSVVENIAARIQYWAATIAPKMDREQRTELASNLKLGSKPNLEFLGLMSAASMLASFGLLQDSAAVIIGAMLIAPLMTPILGAGLALAQGNRPLFQSALFTVVIGFLGALTSSVLFGRLVLMFQSATVTGEMLARCNPSPLDFCVGLVGGIAASYARTRQHLSSALAGAAIAAALVPPISTAGLQIAFLGSKGHNPEGPVISGPLLLVSINVLTIMVGSSFVLWIRGMRSDNTFAIKDRWTVRIMMILLTLVVLAMMWILQDSFT